MSQRNGAVVFVGMDTPELPWIEVRAAAAAARDGHAYVCPAEDGGYCLLGLPPAASPAEVVFGGVKWSDPLTCVSQMGTLAAAGVLTLVGGTYSDVDEPGDLAGVHERSQQRRQQDGGEDGKSQDAEALCPRTAEVAQRAMAHMTQSLKSPA
ncbi:unnamed protein product [Discosporangium mesarthrocarpum]